MKWNDGFLSMIKRIKTCFRYDWPLHLVMLLCAWLPDNVVFLKFRGWLARPFFLECGSRLLLGKNLYFYQPSRIRIGKNVYLAYGTVIIANHDIRIGDDVMVAPYCVISNGRHSRIHASYRFGAVSAKAIRIGSGTWIGSHCSIVDGAVIGSGCLIAANTCVTKKEIPDHSMAGGVPARILKVLTDDDL